MTRLALKEQRPAPRPHHRPDRAKARPFNPTVPGRFITPPPHREPPPGWTPELDRQEEFMSLSYVTLLNKWTPVCDT